MFVMPLCAVCQHTQEQLLPGCGEGLHGSNNGGCQQSVALAEMKVATVQKNCASFERVFVVTRRRFAATQDAVKGLRV